MLSTTFTRGSCPMALALAKMVAPLLPSPSGVWLYHPPPSTQQFTFLRMSSMRMLSQYRYPSSPVYQPRPFPAAHGGTTMQRVADEEGPLASPQTPLLHRIRAATSTASGCDTSQISVNLPAGCWNWDEVPTGFSTAAVACVTVVMRTCGATRHSQLACCHRSGSQRYPQDRAQTRCCPTDKPGRH